jgi:hypothetical protein
MASRVSGMRLVVISRRQGDGEIQACEKRLSE